jgi:RNA polymerase nonessential primary-like sigma factor
VSLDRPVGEGEETSFGALLPSDETPPDEAVAVSLERAALRRAVDRLPSPHRDVVLLRYGIDGEEPQHLTETGRRLGMSADKVRDIENKALKQLAQERELQGVRHAA